MPLTPKEQLVMDGSTDGKPIVPGARVYVVPRPAIEGCGELLGFGGIVDEARPERITLTEFGTCHTRDVRPRDVRVQTGETQASLEHQAIMREARKR